MRLEPCCLALAILTPVCSAAEEVVKVEVKGERYDQRRDDTASTIVLGREELTANGDRTLGEALRRVPGITTGDGNGRGTGIRMRGLGSGYTQILLNGVPAPAGFSLEALAPGLIERVEIVRAASAELGTQAIAGTINIILRTSLAAAKREFQVALERQPNRWSPSVNGQFSGATGQLAYLVGASLSRSARSEPRETLESAGGAGQPADTVRSTASNETNVADAFSLTPRLTWRLGDDDTLTSQGFLSVSRRGIDATARERVLAGSPSEFPVRDAGFRSHAALVRNDFTWLHRLASGAKLEVTLGASHSPRFSDFDFDGRKEARGASIARQVHGDFGDDSVSSKGRYTHALGGGHTLVTGWDGARSKRIQTRVEHEYGPDGALRFVLDQRYDGRIDRMGFFAQDEWERGRWSFSAGLRWETLKTQVRDPAPVRQDSTVLSPVLQAALKVATNDQVRFGLSRTWKAPTMVDLIPRRQTADNNNTATNPDTQGNPALRPESAWGVDAVYDRYLGKDSLLSASAYARRIADVTLPLLYMDGPRWVSMPSNRGRADLHGVALEARLALTPATALRANLARNWSRVASVPAPNNSLDRQTPLSANLGVSHRLGAATFGADFNYQGGGESRSSAALSSTAPQLRRLDAHLVWNIDARQRLRLDTTNLLRQDSISGSQYSDANGWRRVSEKSASAATLRLSFEYNQ